MLEANNFKALKIGIASPEKIRSWSYGEVIKPETINYRTLKPERDGLFCEKIFGPTRDYECSCGKYKRLRYKNIVCDRCGVEVTKSSVRRERMGHIELATPVSHIWYVKGVPSYIGLTLDMSPRDLEEVIYFVSYVVLDPGATTLIKKQTLSDKEYRAYYEKYGNTFRVGMGAEAIKELLSEVDVNKELEEIQKEIKGFEKVDLTAKIQEFNNKKQELENMRRQQMEYHRIFENNNRILVDLQTNSKKLDSKIKEFTMVEDLSKIANGTVYGKRRIEFEQFVQASYFDMVIIEANKRLLKMTDNRFLLVRKESSERVSDKIGLELEVIDNYNGKRRDVKSLSGGEAFKAALSLALGLSDVIQSYSGGIVVDTMFIDEGFGSLDTESREQAINTLNQLTDNHKLIGIISHVTELKERIDKKIIVTKSTGGSKITVES